MGTGGIFPGGKARPGCDPLTPIRCRGQWVGAIAFFPLSRAWRSGTALLFATKWQKNEPSEKSNYGEKSHTHTKEMSKTSDHQQKQLQKCVKGTNCNLTVFDASTTETVTQKLNYILVLLQNVFNYGSEVHLKTRNIWIRGAERKFKRIKCKR
jgi:hypothetical protein